MNLTPLQRRILAELERGSASARELAARLGVPYRTMASRISELKQSGLVDHVVCVTEHGRRACNSAGERHCTVCFNSNGTLQKAT